MSYESHGPEVYQYSAQPYAYSPPNQQLQNNAILNRQPNVAQFQVAPPQVINTSPRDFPPNNSYRPINYPINNPPSYQPNPLPLLPPTVNSNPQPHIQIDKTLLASQAENKPILTSSNQDRFEQYNEDNRQYKYNIFSIADEPWNRCMNGEGCGNLPSNECIARSNYKRYWY